MYQHRSKGVLAVVAVAGLAVLAPRSAHAQMAVFDASSYAELINQVSQSEQQLQAEEKMIQSIPSSILAPVTGLAANTVSLENQISNIEDMGTSLTSSLNSLYPTSFTSGNPQAILDQLAAMNTANREAITTSQEIQNQVAANQATLTSSVSSAVTASQDASGPLAAAQATNQILAAQSQQLGDLQALIIADQKAQQDQAMTEQSEDAAASAFNTTYVAPPAAQSW